MILKLVLVNIFIVIVTAEKVRYDNYALYKVYPENKEHLKFLNDLYTSDGELDFWKPPSSVGEFVSLVSPPERRVELEHSLKKRSIHSDLMLKNIQQ